MPVIKAGEAKNVWEAICKEYEEKKNIAKAKSENVVEFDATKHNPVYFGQAFEQFKLDDYRLLNDFDPATASPISFGYSLIPYKTDSGRGTAVEKRKPVVDRNKCTEREFIEQFVFPTLLPALELMLAEAKRSRCFERKRTAFNACDFITEYLYKNNPFKTEAELEQRRKINVFNIPFARDWLQEHPRPALRKSLIWTETEAAIRMQAFCRGLLVRIQPEVQELRKWQRELRLENQNIVERVDKFWSATPINRASEPAIDNNI